jgi:hypothetical protein
MSFSHFKDIIDEDLFPKVKQEEQEDMEVARSSFMPRGEIEQYGFDEESYSHVGEDPLDDDQLVTVLESYTKKNRADSRSARQARGDKELERKVVLEHVSGIVNKKTMRNEDCGSSVNLTKVKLDKAQLEKKQFREVVSKAVFTGSGAKRKRNSKGKEEEDSVPPKKKDRDERRRKTQEEFRVLARAATSVCKTKERVSKFISVSDIPKTLNGYISQRSGTGDESAVVNFHIKLEQIAINNANKARRDMESMFPEIEEEKKREGLVKGVSATESVRNSLVSGADNAISRYNGGEEGEDKMETVSSFINTLEVDQSRMIAHASKIINHLQPYISMMSQKFNPSSIPEVGRTHLSKYLRPPRKFRSFEKECINGERCFACTLFKGLKPFKEFFVPSEEAEIGSYVRKGLQPEPCERSKYTGGRVQCLICILYNTHACYLAASSNVRETNAQRDATSDPGLMPYVNIQLFSVKIEQPEGFVRRMVISKTDGYRNLLAPALRFSKTHFMISTHFGIEHGVQVLGLTWRPECFFG